MWGKDIILPKGTTKGEGKSMDLGYLGKLKDTTFNTTMGNTGEREPTYQSNFLLGNRVRPARVHNVLQNILKKTFKNNHHENLELSSLNCSQRNYLERLLKKDQSKIPFKLPHRDEESDVREMKIRQMSQSLDISSVQNSSTSRTNLSNFKLPNLNPAKNIMQLSKLGSKRFSSVKSRQLLNSSPAHKINKIEESKIPQTYGTIAEALPLALMK